MERYEFSERANIAYNLLLLARVKRAWAKTEAERAEVRKLQALAERRADSLDTIERGAVYHFFYIRTKAERTEAARYAKENQNR